VRRDLNRRFVHAKLLAYLPGSVTLGMHQVEYFLLPLRQSLHGLIQIFVIACLFGYIVRQAFLQFRDIDADMLHLGIVAAQIVGQAEAGDGGHPGENGALAIVGMAGFVKGDENFLQNVVDIADGDALLQKTPQIVRDFMEKPLVGGFVAAKPRLHECGEMAVLFVLVFSALCNHYGLAREYWDETSLLPRSIYDSDFAFRQSIHGANGFLAGGGTAWEARMNRRDFMKLALGGMSWLALCRSMRAYSVLAAEMIERIVMSKEQWKEKLSPEQYDVLREEGTERPFTSPLNNEHGDGVFACAGCGLELFPSNYKFDSGTGWPSFFDAIPGHVETKTDYKILAPRTEYHCARCGGHQGHVFEDGPKPTGLRYCNNGVALKFVPKKG